MLPVDNSNHFLHNIRILGSYIMVFMDICCQIIKERNTFLNNHFPISHAYAYLVRFIKFPIKKIMFLLVLLTQQSPGKRDTIKIIGFFLLIHIFFREILHTRQITQGRHDVVKSTLVIIHCSGSNLTGPTDNKRNTDTTLVTLAFQATQLPVTPEESGIGPAFLVGTIITGKDDNRIFIQSFLF